MGTGFFLPLADPYRWLFIGLTEPQLKCTSLGWVIRLVHRSREIVGRGFAASSLFPVAGEFFCASMVLYPFQNE